MGRLRGTGDGGRHLRPHGDGVDDECHVRVAVELGGGVQAHDAAEERADNEN